MESFTSGPVLRLKHPATKNKIYLGTVQGGIPIRTRRLARKFRRARDAEIYATIVAKRLPFWRFHEPDA